MNYLLWKDDPSATRRHLFEAACKCFSHQFADVSRGNVGTTLLWKNAETIAAERTPLGKHSGTASDKVLPVTFGIGLPRSDNRIKLRRS